MSFLQDKQAASRAVGAGFRPYRARAQGQL